MAGIPSRYKAWVGALAISLALVAPAEARRVWPGHGAGGGKLSTVECPEGKAMVGVAGARGSFIDRLQIVCATLYEDGTYGPPEPYGDPVGGAGGKTTMLGSCPRNAKLFDMGIYVDTLDMRWLSLVDFHCREPGGAMTYHAPQTKFQSAAEAVRYYGASDTRITRQSCPQEHFVGLKIYFKEYVKAVGVVCDSVEATPVAAPKPLKSTGKARPSTPSGPPVVMPSMMRGAWNTKTGTEGYFTVILVPAHDGVGPLAREPIPVTGQFINQQGAHDYDGTLQGVIRPFTRTLEYSYVQKNGAAGIGVFTLSDDGSQLTGSGKASDGTSFTWNGTRAK
jgi:hypothetical protein